ncbi:MAG: hypothetical protein PHY15_06380 [Eubacteriales bacterium]|nr:hypothetical protein [Eubacteriales bacterium]MDD4476197.1 hypothetical protein [Eubacteriales bacterium]
MFRYAERETRFAREVSLGRKDAEHLSSCCSVATTLHFAAGDTSHSTKSNISLVPCSPWLSCVLGYNYHKDYIIVPVIVAKTLYANCGTIRRLLISSLNNAK